VAALCAATRPIASAIGPMPSRMSATVTLVDVAKSTTELPKSLRCWKSRCRAAYGTTPALLSTSVHESTAITPDASGAPISRATGPAVTVIAAASTTPLARLRLATVGPSRSGSSARTR